ncbi:MAG: hypothetical protein M3X11_04315 [Acidobacteriota bacterium]|nr:hypothetical protein [Acidobacteriota bacterium]
MARGWESKSVEDQVEEQMRTKQQASAVHLSPEAIKLKQKRETLLLQRSRLLEQMQNVRSDTHRQMLERSLQAIDAELAAM